MEFDIYPVYNDKLRPGIGLDLANKIFYNCFTINLAKDSTQSYQPFLFSDFIEQYNRYKQNLSTCDKCIADNRIFKYPVGKYEVDSTALVKKCNPEADFDELEQSSYYCPLIYQTLKASKLSCEAKDAVETINRYGRDNVPAHTISAVLPDGWNDEFLFEFQRISSPQQPQICNILRDLFSKNFVSTQAEKSFLKLWFLSAFHQMETIRASGKQVFLSESDFEWQKSKFFKFVIPIPQVWLYVIPKPPPGTDWQEWENQHKREGIPQRVDFLFVYKGKKYVVEIDDKSHYSENGQASEKKYRQTLIDSRHLKLNGFEIIRFTNDEILELDKDSQPDVIGFYKLLRTVSLEPEHLVFL